MDDKERASCLKLLEDLKDKGKEYSEFEKLLNLLHKYAASHGLDDQVFDLLMNVIINIDLGAVKLVSLIKCLVPRHTVPEQSFKLITAWWLSSVYTLPITVSIIVVQWIIGLWEYQLIDKKVLNIFYGVLFHVMLKKERLDKYIARLIYLLTKPEDVTRREVTRLWTLHRKFTKPQKHIIVLLSLFKSYKPELVPEQIESVNVESAWTPLPEVLQIMFQGVRARSEIQQTRDLDSKSFHWNAAKPEQRKKAVAPLIPSVGYFQIGSSSFKERDTRSIFDITSMEELGKLHVNAELPCNAISLLANTAGYHLLTFANSHYQSRFSYNLYNTLIRALILENERISPKEINNLLDMTAEFSRYMQQGIPVVNHFLDEYLYLNTGEYQSKSLALIQWITSISISDLQGKVLVHVKSIFYESTLTFKCEIIRTLRILITNLFVNQGFEGCHQNTPALFLGQGPVDNLEDILPILIEVSEDLITSGLNIHCYDILLLSEALSFYEQVCFLENRSSIQSFTLAPPAVIYGSFVSKSCAILSRICKLLLRYRDISLQFKNRKLRNQFKTKIDKLCVYAKDYVGALWYDEPFAERTNAYLFNNIPDKVVKDLAHCDLDHLLNINNHYAILPYKWILRKAGLSIDTKEDAMSTALHYYPNVNEFIGIFQT
ncbi:centromere protein I [Andrena cerasifolii]|uniref:centromere protein I n=1 Tax=Andrena cerasifolii TaxID=2819439 RepID=UPI0040376C03